MYNPEIEVHNIWLISEKMIGASYVYKDEFIDVMPNTNPVIAAYTTAHARLKLYSYIEQLNDRVMYFDTDSVIYLSDLNKKGQYEVPIGTSLGEMTDELQDYGDGALIDEFVSGGPKNYAYKIITPGQKQPSYVIKVRGITLTQTTSKRINFKTLRKMVKRFVQHGEQDEINVISNKIDRTRKTHEIVTKSAIKKFRVVYDKRIVRRNFTTVPYGW